MVLMMVACGACGRARARGRGRAVRQHHTHNGAPVSRISTSGNLPAVIFSKVLRSNAKSRPNCAHDAGGASSAQSVDDVAPMEAA